MLQLRRIDGTWEQLPFGKGVHPSGYKGSYGVTYLKAQ